MGEHNEGRAGYKETQFGYFPVDWQVVKLEELGQFSKGSGITKADLVEEGISCVRYGELYTSHHYQVKNFYSFISPELASGSVPIFAGDILFAGSGETAEEIGKCAAYLGSETAYAGGDIIILRPNKGDSKYLGLILNHDAANRQKYKFGQGQSVVHIYSSFLRDIYIPFPPLAEQRKIAEILSTWDRAIELVEQQIGAKQRLKKGLMQQLLTGKVRLNGARGDWTTMCLGDIGAFSKGAGITKADLVAEGFPCIRYGEIYTKHDFIIKDFVSCIPPKIAANSQRIYSGDILFAGSGETAEEIGKCVAFIGDETAYAGGDIIILRLKKGDPSFLGYLLNNDVANRQKYRLGQGHSVVHIYADLLKTITIPYPSIEEQQKIASVFIALEREIEYLHSKMESLQRQKQGLMQKLLTGEVRVRV